MSSNIEWTTYTWNFFIGCAKVTQGCRNCYAVTTTNIRRSNPQPAMQKKFAGGFSFSVHEDYLLQPFKFPRKRKDGQPIRCFVNSLSDTFFEHAPVEVLDKAFAVMAACPHITFQVLSKRPHRMAEYLHEFYSDSQEASRRKVDAIAWLSGQERTVLAHSCPRSFARAMGFNMAKIREGLASGGDISLVPMKPLPNVWLGTSVAEQRDTQPGWYPGHDLPLGMIDYLLQCPAALRFLSCEPLLGPLDLGNWLGVFLEADRVTETIGNVPQSGVTRAGLGWRKWDRAGEKIHWVICGGESGPKSKIRPLDPAWALSLRQQCQSAGVPFFMKQGAQLNWPAFKDFTTFPPDLQVREYPEARQ